MRNQYKHNYTCNNATAVSVCKRTTENKDGITTLNSTLRGALNTVKTSIDFLGDNLTTNTKAIASNAHAIAAVVTSQQGVETIIKTLSEQVTQLLAENKELTAQMHSLNTTLSTELARVSAALTTASHEISAVQKDLSSTLGNQTATDHDLSVRSNFMLYGLIATGACVVGSGVGIFIRHCVALRNKKPEVSFEEKLEQGLRNQKVRAVVERTAVAATKTQAQLRCDALIAASKNRGGQYTQVTDPGLLNDPWNAQDTRRGDVIVGAHNTDMRKGLLDDPESKRSQHNSFGQYVSC